MAGTITDIIKKIRAEADFIEETARGSFKAGEAMGGIAFTESDLESALDLAETKRKEADRLEAALKREMSKNASKNGADFGQLGNAAKLREALEKIVEILNREWDAHRETSAMWEIRDICTAALAAPPRNCDALSAQEQTEKFNQFCQSHRNSDLPKCAGCPLEDIPGGTGCAQAWAQMPYTEGGNDGK